MKRGLPLTMIYLMLLTVAAPSHAQNLTPAQKKINWAQLQIQKDPDKAQFYNVLALAYARRARESGDPQYYTRGQEALGQSLQLAPDNFEARKIGVWLLLGKHEFRQALNAAQRLNRQMPDDIMIYGMLTDAHIELGNYREAETTAQWMLDLRPGNAPGLTRAAYLRELFGDIDGAVDLMVQAYQRTPGFENEERAWLLTQLANLHLSTGKIKSAEQLLHEALRLFPDYHYALASFGRVRTQQNDHEAAAALLHKHYHLAPHPENLYHLAKALDRIGKRDDAASAYRTFEARALLERDQMDNANRELIYYYAGEGQNPAKALRIAQIEFSKRQDVFTRDALAWALQANGDLEEARRQIEKALSVGIRDALIFFHAGAIAAKQGDRGSAEDYFRKAKDLNPDSQWGPPPNNV